MYTYGDRVSEELGSCIAFEGDFYHQDDGHTHSAVSSSVHFFLFQDSNAAPHLPADPAFRLEATTLFIGGLCNSAAGISNSLLSHFDADGTVAVTKVSPVKFALKAKIECQSFRCELKVRVYRHETGHAVEFQRRDGDAVVFASIYQRAASHLKRIWVPHDATFQQEEEEEEIASTELVVLPPMRFLQDAH